MKKVASYYPFCWQKVRIFCHESSLRYGIESNPIVHIRKLPEWDNRSGVSIYLYQRRDFWRENVRRECKDVGNESLKCAKAIFIILSIRRTGQWLGVLLIMTVDCGTRNSSDRNWKRWENCQRWSVVNQKLFFCHRKIVILTNDQVS